MSSSSPCSSLVSARGAKDRSPRMMSETTQLRGSRSSRTVTPDSLDPSGTSACRRSAAISSRGATSIVTSLAICGSTTPRSFAAPGKVGPWIQVKTTTSTRMTSKNLSARSMWDAIGIVAKMIGTAPRRPAQDRKNRSLRRNPNHVVQARTAKGRATKVNSRPAATPEPTEAQVRRSGLASRPSMTNKPI